MATIPMTYSPGSDGPSVYRCCDLVIFHEPQATYHLWRAHELPFLTASAAVEALRYGGNGLAQGEVPVTGNFIEAAIPEGPTVLDAFLVQCEYAHRPCAEPDARRLLDTLLIPDDAPASKWSRATNEAVQRWVDGRAS